MSPSSSSGYHIGIFKQWGGESFFLRPEVVYTKTITSFEGNDLEISSIDIPINIGMRVLGPIYLTGGPLLQNLMDSSYSELVLDEDSSKMRILTNFGAPKFVRILILLCLLYTSPSPRDKRQSRMPSSA